VAGQPNNVNADLKKYAQRYTIPACRKLAEIAGLIKDLPASQNEHVQLGALKELLDRSVGRAATPIVGVNDEPLVVTLVKFAAVPEPETVEFAAGGPGPPDLPMVEDSKRVGMRSA
jgi:hypothetical protein